MDFFRYWAGKLFEDAAGVCAPQDAYLRATGAGNNQSLVAADSTRAIVVLSLTLGSAGVASSVFFKSAANGRKFLNVPSNAVVDPNVILPFDPSGWFQTAVNEALLVDLGAVDVFIGLRYILVSP